MEGLFKKRLRVMEGCVRWVIVASTITQPEPSGDGLGLVELPSEGNAANMFSVPLGVAWLHLLMLEMHPQ